MTSAYLIRQALGALLLLALAGRAGAQCGDRFAERLETPNDQRLVTAPQLLIVRAGYAYSLGLAATQEGVRGHFTSRGGRKPERGDELLLINKDGERKVFRFVEQLSVDNRKEVPVYANVLQFDFATVDWLCGADVTTVTLIDNATNQGRRFTIPASRQAEFRQLAMCFRDAANPAIIPDVPAVATAIPSVSRPSAPPVQREVGLSAKPGSTTLAQKREAERDAAKQEVTDARERLAATKREILEQLALERAKSERARERIAAEVKASRKAAEAEKAAIAAEVLAARERAEQELARVRAQTTRAREALAAGTAEDVAQQADAVRDARARSRAAVLETERSAAEEIAEIRARQAEAAAVERARYAEAEAAYAKEVATARQRSQSEIVDIRKRLETDLAAARREATRATDSTAASVAEVQLLARKRVLAAREASLVAIAAQREAAADAAAAQAAAAAEVRRDHAEAVAAAQAAHRSRISDLEADRVRERETFAAERSRLRDSLQRERERAAVEIAAARALARERVAETQRAADAQTSKIATDLQAAARDAVERVRQIQRDEAAAITRARELAQQRRDSLDQAFAAEYAQLGERRQAARDALAAQIESISRRAAEQDSLALTAYEARRGKRAAQRSKQTAALAAEERAQDIAFESARDARLRQLDSLSQLIAQRRQLLEANLAATPQVDSGAAIGAAVRLQLAEQAREDLAAQRAATERQTASETAARRTQRALRRSRLEAAESEVAAIEAETARRQAEARQTLAAVRKTLAAEVNAAQDRAIEEQEALLADLNAVRLEHAEAIAVAAEAHARERSTLSQEHALAIAEAREQHRRDREALDAELLAYADSTRLREREILAAHTATLDSARAANAAQLSRESEQVAASVAELRKQLAAEVDKADAVRVALSDEHAAQKQALGQEAKDLLKRISQLERQHGVLKTELEALERKRLAAETETPPE